MAQKSESRDRISWKQCCESILSKNEHIFFRAELVHGAFDKFITKLQTQHNSIQDGVICEYFQDDINNNDYVLLKDQFPFHLATNITQYIFTSKSETNSFSYNALRNIIETELNISNHDQHYVFGSFSQNFITTFYPFLADFSAIEIIFVQQNKIHYTNTPTCEPHIIWDECIQYIAEEWYHLFWSHYDPTHTFTKTQQLTEQKNNVQNVCMLFENPFYLFHGIHHYILLTATDVISATRHSTSAMDDFIYNELQKHSVHLPISTNNDSHWLYFEERSNMQFIRPFIDDTIQLLSDILSKDRYCNIFHVLIKNDHAYYDGYEGIKGKITYTWNELAAIIAKGELHKLGRNERWARKYMKERKEYTKIFKDTGAKILIDGFKTASKCVDKANNDWRLEAIVDEHTPRMCWALNDYPYRYYAGIEHNVLWYLGEDEHVLNEGDFIRFIEKHIKPNYVYQIYLNPPHLKSVLELNHVHVVSVDLDKYYETGCGALKIMDTAYEWNVFYENENIQNEHCYEGKIGRTERMCRKYREYWNQNDQIYETRKDVILHQLFQYDVILNTKSGKLYSLSGDNALKGNYKLVPNKFRYNINEEAQLQQFVLFCLEINEDTWSNKEIVRIIEESIDVQKYDYVYWKAKNRKTIHDMLYYNIFIHQK